MFQTMLIQKSCLVCSMCHLLQQTCRMAGNSLLCVSSLLKWLVEVIINKQQDIRFLVTLLDGWLITEGRKYRKCLIY